LRIRRDLAASVLLSGLPATGAGSRGVAGAGTVGVEFTTKF
jgi:hypothetical protein